MTDPRNAGVATKRAFELLLSETTTWQDKVSKLRANATPDPDELRRHVENAFPLSAPVALDNLAETAVDLLTRFGVHTTHPRHFGLFCPGYTPAGVVADALTALFNPQVAAWWYAPAANAIESHVLRFLSRKVGFDGETSAAHFTSGGSEANMTGVIAALTRSFPRVSLDGLRSLGRDPCIYASDQAHDSFLKIARNIGLGTATIRRIPTDASARLDPNLVADAIARDRAAGRAPFLVIATAGTTGSGAIDPIPELASLCRRESLWLHIDAAWGGLALLSQMHRDLLRGIEQADSVTWDLHKVLPVPMGAGAFFCRDRAPLTAAFSVTPKYVPAERPGALDLYRQSLLWSRRAIGLKVLMVIAERGELGIEALVDHVFAMGDLLRQSLVDAGVEIMNASTRLPLVCLAPPQGLSANSLVEVISRDANAWVSEVHLSDDRVGVRVCITNHATQPSDIKALVNTVVQAQPRREGAEYLERQEPWGKWSSDLAVRPLAMADVSLIARYWHECSDDDLERMGVEKAKIPSRKDLETRLVTTIDQDPKEASSYCLVWLVEGKPIGFSMLGDIVFGKTARMHLHMWDRSVRGRGFGAALFCRSALEFYQRFRLESVLCEPRAANPMPNRMLQRVGFKLAKTYTGTASPLMKTCEINRYEIEPKIAESYLRDRDPH